MAREPYVGITGFMYKSEVQALMPWSPRRFMVGILMSEKTLRGMQNRYPNKYPRRENLQSIFSESSNVRNIIHYNTDHPEELLYQLLAMVGLYWDGCQRGGKPEAMLHGFQLNVAWPDPDVIEQFRVLSAKNIYLPYQRRQFEIILQVGSRALAEAGTSKLLAKTLKDYEGLADYVLIDPSGGFGIEMDVALMHTYLQVLHGAGLDIGIGIAGGLSAETLDKVAPLLEEFPDTSIDAEGRLRTAEGHLDLDKAKAYLSKAHRLYSLP